MKQREKLLLGGLVAVLALWKGTALLKAFALDPIDERREAIAEHEARIQEKTLLLERSGMAVRKLQEWNLRSLPPDPVAAAALYQNWLIELAEKSKLINVKVTAARGGADGPGKAETYAVISFKVDAGGTMAQVRDFLYAFRQSGLLHRVSQIALSTESHEPDPVLKIELTAAGLALKNSPARSTLLADAKLAELPGGRPARDRQEYDLLIARNPFVRGNKPAAGGKSPEEASRESVTLVASFSNGAHFNATLRDRATETSIPLAEGSDFSVGGVKGHVLSIGIDFVTFRFKEETWRIGLGESLAQMEKAPAPVETKVAPAEAPGAGLAIGPPSMGALRRSRRGPEYLKGSRR